MSEVVISGIAGRFPQSSNIEEFKQNLFNKVYMVGDPENRVKFKFNQLPTIHGLLKNADKFDYQGFRIPSFVSKVFDPQGRMLLEHSYEAVYDAGISPRSLIGSKTGVYAGCFNYDAFEHWMSNKDITAGMNSIGNAAYALSNKISYLMGINGPSYTVDTACSSSMYALNLAFKDIKNGLCEGALVIGTNLILNPFLTADLNKAGVLTMNGISRPFDENSSGFVRSEACCVLYLQKAENARRVYGTILNSKANNDGFKTEGLTVPSVKMQMELYRETYEELNMNPHDVDFIEAHATSTSIGDKMELQSIDGYFCNDRETPLKVGSVKSNMGHSEGASGAVSVIKSLLMFENEKIIPNINITKLREDCPSLVEGRVKIIQEVEDFDGKIIGVSGFGVLGANAHAVIHRNEKAKIDSGFPKDKMPRLLLFAGRHADGVNLIFDHVVQKPIDDEFFALLQCSQIMSSVATLTRGFAIFTSNSDRTTNCIDRNIQELETPNRPVVFVYSGVGSQWLGMGRDLMKIPLIAEKILECHNVLKSKNVDLIDILTSGDPETFDNCLNIFIGVASIQIALTEVLLKLGVVPNFFIGHSVGELGCAFADKTLTLEETILTAYSRGLAIIEGVTTKGAMAAIAMNLEELEKILPKDIEISCHNSSESCTISGEIDQIHEFVTEVKKRGFLAKIIESSGIPFHSSYISRCGPILRNKLTEIIRNPKPRSSKWISTSIEDENSVNSKFCSIEYHVHNMLNRVKFAEGLSKLPEDSIMIEIAPHGLLRPILKQAKPNGEYINLTDKSSTDGEIFLLQSIGKIYQNGVDMNVREIYPKIDFPVSRGTEMIAPLIRWCHQESFPLPMYDPATRCDKRNLTINLSDSKYSYMSGHRIDGRIILPGTGYLMLVHESLAMMHGVYPELFPVCIEDVKFMKSTVLTDHQDIELTIVIQRGSGDFEIVERNETICRGNIRHAIADKFMFDEIEEAKIDEFSIFKNDFYKELKLRGYHYKDDFCLIENVQNFNKSSRRTGQVLWTNNFATFSDCMAQSYFTNNDSRDLSLPIGIRRIIIDPILHSKMIENQQNCKTILDENGKEKIIFDINIDEDLDLYRSGGVEVVKLEFANVSRRKNVHKPVLESYEFVPHFAMHEMTSKNAAKFCIQVYLENYSCGKLNIVEMDDCDDVFIKSMEEAIHEVPLIPPTLKLCSTKSIRDDMENIEIFDDILNCGRIDILIISKTENISKLIDNLTDSGLIILRSPTEIEIETNDKIKAIAILRIETEFIYVLRKTSEISYNNNEIHIFEIPSAINNFNWINDLKNLLIDDDIKVIIIFTQKKIEELFGTLGFFNCLRKEITSKILKCFIIEDASTPEFDIENSFYKSQLDLRLSVNVFKSGNWGSYRHLNFAKEIEEKSHLDHVFAHVLTRGDLSSLSWLNGDLKLSDPDVIDVHYSSLNFRDILVANQRLTLDYELKNRTMYQYKIGFEFSGITQTGRRVMGISGIKGFTNLIKDGHNGDDLTLFYVPDGMSLADAATIPVVYITVYMAFFFKAHIKRGRSILVHAGSGALGQAAIRTALSYGLKVFTTVGTQEKRAFLLSEFPELEEKNIGNSRDLSFENMIMKRTNGLGVDYVLNSLALEKMQASIRCVKKDGVFLEVGKFDMINGSQMKLSHFLNEIEFKGVFISNKIFNEKPELKINLMKMVQKDVDAGIIQPIKKTIFKANELEKAFRFMTTGKHIGKILLQIRESEGSKMTLPMQVKSRVYFDHEKVYILPGGLGGMGLEIADWMILRNCRKILFSSSRGVSNSYQSYRIKTWESYGVQVQISTADITKKTGCENLIKTANEFGNVGGIFNLAAALHDGLFENQNEEKFVKSVKPKALATKYLDEVSRLHCPSLEFFVVFSSVSCGRGNAGQTNYGLSNSIIEKIVENRRANNLPGTAIQWGPIGDVGMLEKVDESGTFFGFNLQGISSCLNVLDEVLLRNEAIFSSLVCADKLKSAQNDANLFENLIKALGIGDMNSIDHNASLASFGLDSISGTEIQQIFERELEISISLKELRTKTIKEIKNIFNQSKANKS